MPQHSTAVLEGRAGSQASAHPWAAPAWSTSGAATPSRQCGLGLAAALLVLFAVGAYAVLGWRLKYLAWAVILGPFTFARPPVALRP